MNTVNYHILDKQKQVLDKVKTIVKHHKQLTQTKGELFNIYNILNLKTKEVRTHSAFIAELLSPSGTHLMGNAFLEAFISLLPEAVFKNYLDINTTTVTIEFFIATINKKNKTGGRIDILLKDSNEFTISIENKIDAEDQKQQVERYCNYNESKNRVVYLSKFGNEPDEKSKGELISGTDFYIISYQNQIIKWLEMCQTIASDQPILRESIKQYKILIQKITHTLGNQQNNELKTVVINNLEEASLIASKYNQVVRKLKDDFRNKIVEFLKLETKEYSISKKKEVSAQYASIWFNSEVSATKKTWFAAESFSGNGHADGVLFVGVFSKNKAITLGKEYNSLNKAWIHHQVLKYENEDVNLSESSFLQKISTKEQLEVVAKEVTNQILAFVKENEHLLKD
jgi:hypothetical protein